MVTVKYATKFKAIYEKLLLDVQQRFLVVDASVIRGDLSRLRPQPFDRYVAYLDADHAAYGKLLPKKPRPDAAPDAPPEFVFLWIFIGSKKDVPVIL